MRRYYREEERKSIPVIVVAIILLVAAIVFALIFTGEACSRPEKKFLVVGTNTPFPPFELKRGEDVVGFDIDMAKEIARAMNKKLVIKDFTEFDALLPALQAGSLDIVASSVTIREDRDEVVDFSTPYYSASQGILTKKGGKFSQDFSGMRVAYQEGTTSQLWAEEKKVAGKVFKDMNLGVQLLVVGEVDAIIMDTPAAKNFAKINPNLMFAGEIETGEQYGLVVQQGDPKKLLPIVNKVIAEMKSDGRYQRLLEKWFGGEK